MDFYITQNGIRRGPFRVFQVKEMVECGEASPADLGWHNGLSGWLPLREIDAIAPYLPRAEEAPADDIVGPSAPKELGEPDAPPDGRTTSHPAWNQEPARARETQKWQLFGRRALPRFLARSFDNLLWFSMVCAVGSSIGALPPTAFTFPGLVSVWFIPLQSFGWVLLEAWLLSRLGTTPGKWLFNLHVRQHQGGLPTFKNALKRAFFIWVFAWGLGHGQWAMFGSLISLLLFLLHGRMVWDHLVGTEIIIPHPRPAAWVVFSVALGIFLAAKVLLAVKQPLPEGLPPNVRSHFEQQKARLREVYRQSQPNDPQDYD